MSTRKKLFRFLNGFLRGRRCEKISEKKDKKDLNDRQGWGGGGGTGASILWSKSQACVKIEHSTLTQKLDVLLKNSVLFYHGINHCKPRFPFLGILLNFQLANVFIRRFRNAYLYKLGTDTQINH